MSESFDISTASGSYSVSIEPGWFTPALLAGGHSGGHQDVFIADHFFADRLFAEGERLQITNARTVFYYEASEAIKSLETVPPLIEKLRRAGVHRQTRMVAIGGGTIQDLAAFAASIYMRGLQWIYVPTTLLAMADSCIGGKSSINVGAYKNLVGTFHPPSSVFIDPELARTLSFEQQASGLIEAAKICFCRGLACFRDYLACNPRPGMDASLLATVISHSLSAKKWFIEKDEFDQNERILLNLGHTFGHAIEGASNYAIGHGIAVGMGILCALVFRRQTFEGCCSEPAPIQQEVKQLEEHLHGLLGHVSDLSSRLAQLDLDDVMERFESDKKHRQDCYVLVLISGSGQVGIEPVEKSPQSAQDIRNAIARVLSTCIGRSSSRSSQ